MIIWFGPLLHWDMIYLKLNWGNSNLDYDEFEDQLWT